MKLIEIKSGKKTHYVNPEYIVAIKEWITEGTWTVTMTEGEAIFINKEMVDKIRKETNND